MTGFDPRVEYTNAFPYDSGRLYNGFNYYGENNGPWLVEIGFDLAANGVGDWFTLDDPVKSVLDNTTYLLSGEVLTDITRWVRSISVKRGRSRQLEKFVAGACEVTFDNRDRIFDPTMQGSPFYGSIVPRKAIRISYNGYPVFAGNTQDWDFDYDAKTNDATATVKALDGFAYLASQSMPQQTMTAQLSGARVTAVLNSLGWPVSQQSVDTGSASLAADVVTANTNALGYLQKVEVSQNGLFFISREGLIRFEDTATGVPTGVIVGQNGIKFIDYEVVYGAEELWNKVNVTYLSGATTLTVTADDSASQDSYGIFETTYDTLLSGSVQANALASTLVTTYSQPRYRVNKIVFDMRAIGGDAVADIMSIEMGDQLSLQYQPSNVGEALDRTVLVDGIEHSVTPSAHRVTMSLTDLVVA